MLKCIPSHESSLRDSGIIPLSQPMRQQCGAELDQEPGAWDFSPLWAILHPSFPLSPTYLLTDVGVGENKQTRGDCFELLEEIHQTTKYLFPIRDLVNWTAGVYGNLYKNYFFPNIFKTLIREKSLRECRMPFPDWRFPSKDWTNVNMETLKRDSLS